MALVVAGATHYCRSGKDRPEARTGMDLNRAATFLRVVEAGGFTAAATALGLPTSSVIGIVVGRLPDSSLTSRRLGDAIHQLHAAPAYLAARGQPSAFSDLARHATIVLGSGVDHWELTGPDGTESVALSPIATADHLGF